MSLILAILTVALPMAAAGATGDRDAFECGKYEVLGVLTRSPDGGNLLEVWPGTTRRYSLVLRRLEFDQAIAYAGKPVRAEIEVFRPGSGAEAAVRVVGPLHRVPRSDTLRTPVRRLSKGACAP